MARVIRAEAVSYTHLSELGKRRKEEEGKERKVILSSRDVYQYFYPLMCDLPIEAVSYTHLRCGHSDCLSYVP